MYLLHAHAVDLLLAPDTLVEASTWPDEIRSDDNWQHAGPWHYVNIADGKEYAPTPRAAG